MWITCRFGFHKWSRLPNQLGSYGMGLEWFKCWECVRCGATADELRESRGVKSYMVHRADPEANYD